MVFVAVGANKISVAAERRPLPPPAELKKAEKLARELFAGEIKNNDPTKQKALAVELLQKAQEAAADPASYYVMLAMAWQAAVKGGDAATAMKAVDAVAVNFHIRTAKLRGDLLEKLEPPLAASGSEARRRRKEVAEQWLKLVESAAKEKSFNEVKRAAEHVRTLAKLLGRPGLAAEAEAKAAEAAKRRKAWEDAKAAAQTLRGKPNDHNANRRIGLYFLLWEGDWDKAQAYLLRSGDEKWRKIIAAEAQRPGGAEALKLAELWREQALELEKTLPGTAAWKATKIWGNRAAAGLNGLMKIKAERLLTAVNEKLRHSAAGVSSSSFIAGESTAQWLRRRKSELLRVVPKEYRDNFKTFRRSLYLYVPEVKSISEVMEDCEKWGGVPVCVETKSENDFLANWLRPFGREVWLGCSYEAQTAQWEWQSGLPWAYVNWDESSRDRPRRGSRAILTFRRKSCWKQVGGKEKAAFVCEWEKPFPPVGQPLSTEVLLGSYDVVAGTRPTYWRITFFKNGSAARVSNDPNPMRRASISGAFKINDRTVVIRWQNAGTETYTFGPGLKISGRDWNKNAVALIPLD